MKIRTLYFKVDDMQSAARFWQSLLQLAPAKTDDKYHEFKLPNINLGLVLNDFGDRFTGSNCVPVFEFNNDELKHWVERAKSLGASVILDALNNPSMLSVVFADPWGNEFELSQFHD